MVSDRITGFQFALFTQIPPVFCEILIVILLLKNNAYFPAVVLGAHAVWSLFIIARLIRGLINAQAAVSKI